MEIKALKIRTAKHHTFVGIKNKKRLKSYNPSFSDTLKITYESFSSEYSISGFSFSYDIKFINNLEISSIDFKIMANVNVRYLCTASKFSLAKLLNNLVILFLKNAVTSTYNQSR